MATFVVLPSVGISNVPSSLFKNKVAWYLSELFDEQDASKEHNARRYRSHGKKKLMHSAFAHVATSTHLHLDKNKPEILCDP